jgi:hypothetical protein
VKLKLCIQLHNDSFNSCVTFVYILLILVIYFSFRVARVVAPKKIALKEAESDLAVAMEVYFLQLALKIFITISLHPIHVQLLRPAGPIYAHTKK